MAVGVVRRDDPSGKRIEVLADIQIRVVVARLCSGPLVARPAEVLDGSERVGDAVDLLPDVPADIAEPDLVRSWPDREAERVPHPVGDDPAGVRVGLDASGLFGMPSPVSGLTRRIAPSSVVGSDVVRRSWLRSAPPSALGGVRVAPTPPGGSPHGLSGLPS